MTLIDRLADPSARLARARVRRVAREHLGESLASLFLRQAWTELAFGASKHLRFRRRENAEAVRAYCAMTAAEFEGINARQRWANWRTIPRNLHGRLPRRPCRALDLCSGIGDSTEVLAYYLPRGSEILGLEYNPAFVRHARRRTYGDERGFPVKTSFHAQSVLETFRDGSGAVLPDRSVDLVNSCGSLGIHFDRESVERLAVEIARVIKPGGLALVDSARNGVDQEQMTRIFGAQGFERLSSHRSCFLDRFTQICFQRV